MSPYQLHILLHYYASASDYQDRGEPIFQGTMQEFVREGLLEKAPEGSTPKYFRTPRLICYIEHICNLPLPVWAMPSPEGVEI